MALGVLVLTICMTTQPLVLFTRADVDGPIVRLSDVADLETLPAALRDRAARIAIHRATAGASTLSSRVAAARARAAMPALAAWLPDGTDHDIQIEAKAAPPNDRDRTSTLAPAPVVAAGDTVTVVVQVGPVTVERETRALQAGWPGRPIFVRTDEGRVLTAMIGGQ